MPETHNSPPKGKLTAKLLTSAALVLASGAYVFLQPSGKAPATVASRTAALRFVARAEPQASMPAPGTRPGAAPKQPTRPEDRKRAPLPDKSALAEFGASTRERSPEGTTPPAVVPFQEAIAAPPAVPEAPAPPPLAPESNVGALAPPARQGLADGDYTGDPADCQWGSVQVEIHVQGGAVAQVNFLQVPDHRRRSAEISDWAMPVLAQEAVKAQNNNVDLVSGATATSFAFQQAFANALGKAKR